MLFDHAMLNRLYRYAYALLGEEAGAYDLLQDTVERCLRKPPAESTSPEGYARRVMRNRYIDLARRRRVSPEVEDANGDIETLAIDTQCLEEMMVSRQQLERVWSQLQGIEREILYLWAIDGMTAAEIAAATGSRRGTVLSRIHRLRRRLGSDDGASVTPSETP